MNKPTEGRGSTLVSVPKLDIAINSSMSSVTYDYAFFVEVKYLYEAAIKPLEDDPGCPEYVQALSIKLLSPLYLSGEDGITMSIDSRCELLEILTFAQIEAIETSITANNINDAVKYAEPIRAKLCTSDNMRLPEDDEVMRNLGHNLVNREYER